MPTVDIQIKSIENEKNEIINGQLNSDEADFGLKINKDTGEFTILWTFKFNLENNRHIIHKSKTVFKTKNLTLDKLSPSEKERIDLFTQLGQISMDHSRVLFINENPNLDYIPLIIWRHQLTDKFIQKLSIMSN